METGSIITARHAFVKAVAEALKNKCRVEPGHRLLLAVSGGADSMAMLRALHLLARQKHWRLDLHVAHVNHNLRHDAEADQRFVIQAAGALGLPVTCESLDAQSRTGNTEAWARTMRYAFLEKQARRIAADAVAVAHHADDQMETLIMRLIRGASPAGLSGMRWRRRMGVAGPVLIRPMLAVDRSRAVAFLTDLNQPWREDATNADLSRWRARLRAEVLPVLRELRPSASHKAVQTTDDLAEVAIGLRRAARRAGQRGVTWAADGQSATLARPVARRWPLAVLMELVRAVSLRIGVPADALDHETTATLARAVRGTGGETKRFDLAGGVAVHLEGESVRWIR